MEDKKMTPEEWEASVKNNVINYVEAFLKMSKSCNMGTLYYHPVKEEYESHTDYDQSKIAGVELRIVFDFDEVFDKDKLTFI